MAAQLLAGLAKSVVKSGTKKLAVKKVKSFARDKTKEKVKGKLSKKSQILSSESDQQEKKLKISSMDGGVTSTPAGTMDSVKISPASDSKSQIEQLKINVTNIHSFLVKSNKQYKKQEADTRRNDKVQKSKSKLGGEEKRLEKGSSPLGKSMSNIKDAVSSTGGIFERIMNFVGLLLLGIAVNALPAIIEKVKEIVDNIVNFLTPIQSGFKVIMSFFTGDINEDELNVDKKRFDDGIQKITGKDGLFDQIKKKMGPFGFLIDLLRPAIDKIREALGLKNAAQKITLAKKGGKEGFVDVETGKFTEKQFTSEERERYEKNKNKSNNESDSTGGQTSEGKSTPVLTKVTNLNYGLVNPTPNTNILNNKGGYAADTGLDIIGKVGDPIVSPVDGILEYAERGHTTQMGQDSDPTKPGIQDQLSFRIRLNKPFTFEGKRVNFVYGTHLSTLDTGVANKFDIPIKAGQRLGTMGVANNVPHLHIGFIKDRSQTGFLNFKEVRKLLSGQSSDKQKKGAAGLMKGVKKDERNKQISMINQPMDEESTTTIAIQQVNTIQTAYVPMPIPMKSRSMGSTSSPTLSPIWSA